MYQDAKTVYSATDQLIQTINANVAQWGVRARYATASEYFDALLNSTRGRHLPTSIEPIHSSTSVGRSADAAGNASPLGASSAVAFPVVSNGSTFFPYRTGTSSPAPEQDWSGYFTSRPTLKRLSTIAHTTLGAAETLFALHGRSMAESARVALWPSLEAARRKAAIFQHHDAITGTFCQYDEGCIGGLNSEDQDVGSHNVLGDYRTMLTSSADDANAVIVGVLPAALASSSSSHAASAALPAEAAPPARSAPSTTAATPSPRFSTDPTVLGNILMGNGDGGDAAELVVFNPLAHAVTEAITVPVPLCAISVIDAVTGHAVTSQTTAALLINSGEAPYYDFELSFVAVLPALGFRRFTLTPVRSVPPSIEHAESPLLQAARSVPRTPRAGSPAAGTAGRTALLGQTRGWACPAAAGSAGAVSHTQIHGWRPARCGNPAEPCLSEAQPASAATSPPWGQSAADDEPTAPPAPPSPFHLENALMRLTISPRSGLQEMLDKRTNQTHAITHQLVEWRMSQGALKGAGPAYLMEVEGLGSPLLGEDVYASGSLSCRAWRQTSGCDANGERQPGNDLPCTTLVGATGGNVSGYCECAHPMGLAEWRLVKLGERSCKPARAARCEDVCAAGGVVSREAIAASLALGPVVHEAWLQISDQHRERIRIWQTDDPALGARIEIGARIGVLSPMTEISSRLTLAQSEASSQTTFYSEDNAYERVPHAPGVPTDGRNLSAVVYPSQASAYLRDAAADLQLSVALGRAHGVAAFSNGSVEIFQHRRAIAKWPGKTGSVVLDDTDRLFSHIWLSLGHTTTSNRDRVAMKLALSHPPVLAFSAATSASPDVGTATHIGIRNGMGTSGGPAAEHPMGAVAGRSDVKTRALYVDSTLAEAVHLQSVRAYDANVSVIAMRFQHLYARGEDPSHSAPMVVNLEAVLDRFLPAGIHPVGKPQAMTLDGTQPVDVLNQRRRFPTSLGAAAVSAQPHQAESSVRGADQASPTSLQPMELATFRVQLG